MTDKKFKYLHTMIRVMDLEKSIEFYTRGSHLKAHCQQKLNDAVLKLEEIKVSSDGKVSKKEIE